VIDRIAPRFTRHEPLRRAAELMAEMVSGLDRKNCWTIANTAAMPALTGRSICWPGRSRTRMRSATICAIYGLFRLDGGSGDEAR
jgi:hypothetical protein